MLRAAEMTRVLALLALVLLHSRSTLPAPAPDLAIPCSQIVSEVTPCLSFISGQVDVPTQKCCDGIKDLGNAIKSKANEQAACVCIKDALSKLKYDPSSIPDLPKKCGVHMTLPPIKNDTDCSRISF